MNHLPNHIQRYLQEEPYVLDDVGMSKSTVVLFSDKVLKIQPMGCEADNEVAVMKWLQGKLPVPTILEEVKENGNHYVLMSKMTGTMACDETYLNAPHVLIPALVDGLKRLWSVDLTGCPSCFTLEYKLQIARSNVERDLIDMSQSEPETYGEHGFRDPAELLEWLVEHKPEEELVFTHGDFCLPNIFLADGALSGFIDLGMAGIMDKWQDIALCHRSLRHNLDGKYSGIMHPNFDPDGLFQALGIAPDHEKMRYYLLLDELF
jgi:aminoglycoside phosphotransferase